MKIAYLLALSTIALATPAICGKTQDIGPPPLWEPAKNAAKAVITADAGLLDPFSVRWQWRRGGMVTTKKGHYICGRLNARNQYGGYAGWQSFFVRSTNGRTDQWRMAPQGLGLDVCDIRQGFEDEPAV